MGFPMIQVFMIAARQVSKPIADMVLRYGKDHPGFRNKMLIPIGRGLVRFTTRLRMKRLGLGEPTVTVQVSEAAALEQASDFVQQLVLFCYSLGVFSGYYFYSQMTSPSTVKAEEFDALKEEHAKAIEELRNRLEDLEKKIANNAFSKVSSGAIATPSTSTSVEKRPKFERVSSLPIDAAARIVLEDTEYLVVRSGNSVGIEQAEVFRDRGEPLTYRKKELVYDLPRPGLIGHAERFVWTVFGRWSG